MNREWLLMAGLGTRGRARWEGLGPELISPPGEAGARWRNSSSWLSRQAFGHRNGRAIHPEALVFLDQWEKDILEQVIWGNPGSWMVASETSVSRSRC